MQSNADAIRQFAGRYVDQARRDGQSTMTILVGDVVREMRLNNRVPAVCSALGSKRFQEQNGLVLVKREGPASGQSTTSRFTYSLATHPEASISGSDFASLRGAGKATFSVLGGGENFLKRERREFADN